MKGFALTLLCLVALVQARSTGVQNGQKSAAALGDAPWFVHLRLAVSTSGFLKSCAGVLIDQSWVLTTADCTATKTYAWIRYGVVDVIHPSLVTENSQTSNPAIVHPEANLALINIRRDVHSTESISPVAVANEVSDAESATFCAFGGEEVAGSLLSCYDVSLEADGESVTAYSETGKATEFDLGAPLVVDGKLIGLLDKPGNDDTAGVFLSPANYIEWIEEQTGLDLSEAESEE